MIDVAQARTPVRTGLVLSGGGAKGAYQVGVVKALAELGTQIDAISGASIGALNGAVLSCAGSLTEGALRLERLWLSLAENSPVEIDSPYRKLAYLGLLAAAGMPVRGIGLLVRIAAATGVFGKATNDEGLFSDRKLKSLMDEYLTAESMASGIPLYVSAYESHGGLVDIMRVISAEIGFLETPASKIFSVQDYRPIERQRDLLLASAALPLLYKSRNIDGNKYSDGGQGGWRSAQGNTPAQPLIDQAGCNQIIVTHLSDGSLWSRHKFPDVTVLEIRPQQTISRGSGFLGGPKDLLGFDSKRIPSWIEQGYTDTIHCVSRVKGAVQVRQNLKDSESALAASWERAEQADEHLREAMRRLK